MKKILKILNSSISLPKVVFVFFFFYTLFYFSVPYIAKKVISDKLKEEYNVSVSLESFEIEPISGDIKLKKLSLSHLSEKEPFVSCALFDLNVGYFGLLRGNIAVDAININGLDLKLSRDENKTLNIQKIFPSKNDKKESKAVYFAVNNINIKSSNIVFKDDITKQKYELKNIDLSLPFISNIPYETDIFTAPHFKAVFNGSTVELNGTTRPFAKDLKSEIAVSFDDFNLSLANAFLPKSSGVEHVSGFLSIKSKILFEKSKSNMLKFKADANVRDLAIDMSDAKISLKSLEAKTIALDTPDTKNWKLDVALLRLDGSAKYKEWVVDNFVIGAKNLQNYKDEPFDVAAQVKSKYANVECNASIALKSKVAKGDLRLTNAPLSTINDLNVLPPKLKIYGGELGALAKFDIKFDHNISAKVQGNRVDIKDFSLYADNRNSRLIGFDMLSFSNVDMEYPKNKVDIAGAALSGLYANIKITKDKNINLVKYFETNATTASANQSVKKEEKAKQPFDFTLQKFTLHEGTIDFEDRSLKQKFKTSLTDITGSIGALSLNKKRSSPIELKANSGGYGRIAIVGDIVPDGKNFALNLKTKTIDIPMTQFTPYTEKFIGYKIESGALGLDLDYKILGRSLNSSNKISLLGFSLGDEVESKDATKLPYKLALAILKDDKGNIDIELPVEGSLDDPDIKSGQVVWKFIIQLITKVIKSPFNAIAGLLGGGDEHSYVAFGYGSSVLSEAESSKLQKTAEFINKKPNLKVELRGYIDSEKDVIGYKEELLKQKLIAAKMKDLKLKTPTTVNENEYEKYLKEVYGAEKFPKPKNFLGLNKSLNANDMKTLIITHTEVGAKELDGLARTRAHRVQEELIKNGVAKERISVSTKELSAPEPREKAPNSRVEIGFI